MLTVIIAIAVLLATAGIALRSAAPDDAHVARDPARPHPRSSPADHAAPEARPAIDILPHEPGFSVELVDIIPQDRLGVPVTHPDPDRFIQTAVLVDEGPAARARSYARLVGGIVLAGAMVGFGIVLGVRGIAALIGF